MNKSESESGMTHDWKKAQCTPLASTCEKNGVRVHLLPIEVDCLGYCPHSLLQSPGMLGQLRSTARHICTECSRVVLRCPYLSYRRRKIREWNALHVLYLDMCNLSHWPKQHLRHPGTHWKETQSRRISLLRIFCRFEDCTVAECFKGWMTENVTWTGAGENLLNIDKTMFWKVFF